MNALVVCGRDGNKVIHAMPTGIACTVYTCSYMAVVFSRVLAYATVYVLLPSPQLFSGR